MCCLFHGVRSQSFNVVANVVQSKCSGYTWMLFIFFSFLWFSTLQTQLNHNISSLPLHFLCKESFPQSTMWSQLEHPPIKLRNSEQTEETCVCEPWKRQTINMLFSLTPLWWIEAAQCMCCFISYTHVFKSKIRQWNYMTAFVVSLFSFPFLWQIWTIGP